MIKLLAAFIYCLAMSSPVYSPNWRYINELKLTENQVFIEDSTKYIYKEYYCDKYTPTQMFVYVDLPKDQIVYGVTIGVLSEYGLYNSWDERSLQCHKRTNNMWVIYLGDWDNIVGPKEPFNIRMWIIEDNK